MRNIFPPPPPHNKTVETKKTKTARGNPYLEPLPFQIVFVVGYWLFSRPM